MVLDSIIAIIVIIIALYLIWHFLPTETTEVNRSKPFFTIQMVCSTEDCDNGQTRMTICQDCKKPKCNECFDVPWLLICLSCLGNRKFKEIDGFTVEDEIKDFIKTMRKDGFTEAQIKQMYDLAYDDALDALSE